MSPNLVLIVKHKKIRVYLRYYSKFAGYDVEDIDDFEYGKSVADEQTFNGFGDEDIEEDEKLLEDLEDKQLRERIASLESDHSNTKEQVRLNFNCIK